MALGMQSCGGEPSAGTGEAGKHWSISEVESCAPGGDGPLTRSALIAHAGGLYNDHSYTNSLEAINHSYALGFRLIELDLMRTADGEFVGAHDWPGWRERTRWLGDTKAPTTEQFLQRRLPSGIKSHRGPQFTQPESCEIPG